MTKSERQISKANSNHALLTDQVAMTMTITSKSSFALFG